MADTAKNSFIVLLPNQVITIPQDSNLICFNEESDIIDVWTHNTDLRNRLLEFSEQYPDCCKLTDDEEHGGMLFEILKGRLGSCIDNNR